MSDELHSNRDFIRENKSCTSIRANMLSLLSAECMRRAKKQKCEKNEEVLDLAIECIARSTCMFNKAQQATTKISAERYAQDQHSLILRSNRYKEDITSIPSISQNIVSPEILAMYNNLTSHTTND